MDGKIIGEMGINQEHAVAQLAASLVGYANTSIGHELPSIERLEVIAASAKRFILANQLVNWMMELCAAVPELQSAEIHIVSTPELGHDGEVRYDFDVRVSNLKSPRFQDDVEYQTQLWILEEGTYPTFARELLAVDPKGEAVLALMLCRDSLPWTVRDTEARVARYFLAFREAAPQLAHNIEVGLQFGADANKVQDRARDRPRAA